MEEKMPHSLTLSERSRLTVSGVEEVVSFDDSAAVLRTGLGELMIQGQELRLKNLYPEGGTLEVQGTISALSYEQSREGFWHRLMG